MKELFDKIARFNQELEATKFALTQQSQGQLIIKKILLEKKIQAAEKKLFDHFESQRDSEYEQAALDTAKVRAHLEAKDTDLSERMQAAFYAQGKKDNDPLGEEIIPLSEDSSELPEGSQVPDYDDGLGYEGDTEEEANEIAREVALKEKGKQESFALNITLNNKQLIAKSKALAGQSFCLIGPAGTGKTTAQRAVAEALLQDHRLSTCTYKYYTSDGDRKYVQAPSIAFCAYTRRAAANLRKAVHKSPLLAKELQHNIMTIHALLEFEPETYEDYNEEGKLVTKFRFVPRRDANNPLTITHLVIEEASMVDAYGLWQQLFDALPPNVQIILIGDINQLPPVFGPSILNYALVQLPIVELTEVYRNQGIILENAHNILAGKQLKEDQNFVIVRGKSPVQIGQMKMASMLGLLFNQWLDLTGSDGLPEYDPDDCIILSPFNKQDLGTINLNNWIAQHLGARRKAIVFEVIAGFNKLYLAVGDRVMINKMDGVIVDITKNPQYHGRTPQLPGTDLTRFGQRILGKQGQDSLDALGLDIDYSNFSIEAVEAEKAERKQQASHVITVQLENGKTEELKGAGDFGDQVFSLGYALTVHKAQGSEWRKVFIILHKDHAVSLYRELFYTAVTRARTKVTIIAKDSVINRAIENQRIKGDTIADKLEYFNSGIMDNARGEIHVLK